MMKNLKLMRISPHVYWTAPEESTDRPVLGSVVGRNATLMVEGGASASHAAGFLAALSSPGIPLPKYMAITHWHWDHVFGAAYLDLPIIAHVDTARKIREMSELDWRDEALDRRVAEGLEIEFCQVHMKAEIPNEERASLKLHIPEITFKDRVSIDLGGVTCQIIHVGGDHSPDSSIVYIPGDKVAFIGDCIYEDIYARPSRYTTVSLFPLLDQLLGLGAIFTSMPIILNLYRWRQ
jgi:glyoxylase-like metal-dependent hydrolase (beta-lactamase superfamily II)